MIQHPASPVLHHALAHLLLQGLHALLGGRGDLKHRHALVGVLFDGCKLRWLVCLQLLQTHQVTLVARDHERLRSVLGLARIVY